MAETHHNPRHERARRVARIKRGIIVTSAAAMAAVGVAVAGSATAGSSPQTSVTPQLEPASVPADDTMYQDSAGYGGPTSGEGGYFATGPADGTGAPMMRSGGS